MYGRKEVEPPLVKGGQGRSDEDVYEDGVALTKVGAILCVVLVVVYIIVWLVRM